MITDDFAGIEVINGDAEEALDLGTVEVHRKDTVCSRGFDGVGADAGANGDARFVFFVTFGIAEVGDDCGDLSGTCAFQCVDPEQQFHKVVVDRTMDSLDYEAVAAADIFEDTDEDIAFAEHLCLAGGECHTEAVGYSRGKEWVAGPGENGKVSHWGRGSGEVGLESIRGRIHWQRFRARKAGRAPPENEGWHLEKCSLLELKGMATVAVVSELWLRLPGGGGYEFNVPA